MTIKRNVQLPRSSVKGAKPRVDELDYGNLAVNFFAGDEFLSTKNSNNEVVVFPSKNYIEKHPFSSLTIDNLAVNSGASISGNTIIDGNLKVSGDTYLGAKTYVKSGNTLVTFENFITATAKADGNDYITGGTATRNTISLTGKGSARATITGVVTTDKVDEAVNKASNGKFVHTTGDTMSGHLKVTATTTNGMATKTAEYGDSSIKYQNKEIKYPIDKEGTFAVLEKNSNGKTYLDLGAPITCVDNNVIEIPSLKTNQINIGNKTIKGIGNGLPINENGIISANDTKVSGISVATGINAGKALILRNSDGTTVSADTTIWMTSGGEGADGNNYVTGGSAKNNTITLNRKDLTDATISGVVTTDKVAEAVKSASNGTFVHTSGDTMSGHLKVTATTTNGMATKTAEYGESSIKYQGKEIKYPINKEGTFAVLEKNSNGKTYLDLGAPITCVDNNVIEIPSLKTNQINIGNKTIKGIGDGLPINENGIISANDTKVSEISIADGNNAGKALILRNSDGTTVSADTTIWMTSGGGSNWEAGQGESTVLLKNSSGSAEGGFSVSEGKRTSANGYCSHAEGVDTNASGDYSHAEGAGTIARKYCSHAEGGDTNASGINSHAEGYSTLATGNYSHAEGEHTSASGDWSHAEGFHTWADGNYSHTVGNYTIAMNDCEHACGCYNRSVSGSGQLFSVGAGTSDTNRVNSFYVKNDGTIGSDLDMSISGESKITLSTASDRLIMSGGTLTTNCTMTTGAHFTTSDERLKTNIIDVTEDEIEKAKKVDLKSFELKRDGKKHFGVVAQEVETAGLAELVNTDSEGMKSVDYTSLLILKIAELEKEIKDLKNQINKK